MNRVQAFGPAIGVAFVAFALSPPSRADEPLCDRVEVSMLDARVDPNGKASGAAVVVSARETKAHDEATIKLLKAVVSAERCSMLPLLALADAQRDAGQPDDAAATYGRMVAITPIRNSDPSKKMSDKDSVDLIEQWNTWREEAQMQLKHLPPAKVVVSVRPLDAVITLDGKGIEAGMTIDVDAGSHPVRVTAPGYQTHSETVRGTRSAPLAVNVILEKYDGASCKNIEPYEVALGAVAVDEAANQHPCNPEVLLRQAQGQQNSGNAAQVEETLRRIANITFLASAPRAPQWTAAQATAASLLSDLQAQTTLLVRVSPDDSNPTIVVDGKVFERDGNIPIPSGQHRVQVTADGWRPYDESVQVEDAQHQVVNVELARQGANPFHVVGVGALLVGGLATAVGLGFGTAALVERNHALDDRSLCEGHGCTPAGTAYVDRTRTHATWATRLVVFGLPVAAVGGLFVMLAPVSADPSSTGAMFTWRGAF